MTPPFCQNPCALLVVLQKMNLYNLVSADVSGVEQSCQIIDEGKRIPL